MANDGPYFRFCHSLNLTMRNLSDIVLKQNPLMLPGTVFVTEACRQMFETRAGSVLVVNEQNRLEGIFTGRDAVHRVIAAGLDSNSTLLSDVMTPDPVTMPPDNSAIEALRLMWDGGFRHVPVVNNGLVLGVVSRGDFKGDENGVARRRA